MKSNLTYGFILKAWLGHYITGRCAIDMIRLKRERERKEKIAKAEAERIERLGDLIGETTQEFYEKNARLLEIARG